MICCKSVMPGIRCLMWIYGTASVILSARVSSDTEHRIVTGEPYLLQQDKAGVCQYMRVAFSSIVWMGFYVKMYDGRVPSRCRRMEDGGFCCEPQVCLLEGMRSVLIT